MIRHPGSTAAALITLALGIGANTAIFSIVYGVLFRPLPYKDADRLVRVWEEHPGGNPAVRGPLLSNRTFYSWREGPQVIDHLAAFSRTSYTLTGAGDATRVAAGRVSPALFEMLGATPAAGRLLSEDDAASAEASVVVLSHGFWRERFGADPNAIGGTLALDGRTLTIVGVAQPSFYFPDRETRLWVPFRVPRVPTDQSQQSIEVFGAVARLRQGGTLEQAAAEGTAAARNAGPRGMIAELIFGKGGAVEVRTARILDEMTSRVRPALVLLAIGVGFVLLIACANVANLLLSRGVARQRELAVRGAISGVLPGLRASAGDFTNILRAGISPGTRNRRIGASLLLVEAALCVMLLVGAGLLIRSFITLANVEPGFDPSNVLMARMYLSSGERPPAASRALVEGVLERVRAQPGVVAAGASNMAPFVRGTAIGGFTIPGTGPDGQPRVARAVTYTVTPGYAEALKLRLREGRFFEPGDTSSRPIPILINDEFVRAYLTDGRPILGRQIGNTPPRQIVGVVGHVLKDGLDTAPQAEIYLPLRDEFRRLARHAAASSHS